MHRKLTNCYIMIFWKPPPSLKASIGMNIQQYRNELESRKSKRDLLQQQLEQCSEKIEEKQKHLDNLKKER